MFYPDFRAHERAFQLILQVSGRAGRSSADGKVLVQSFQKEHQLFKYLQDYDYKGFYHHQIRERNTFFYPPFSRLIKITLKGAEKNDCVQGAQLLYQNLARLLGDKRVLPPHEPIISKIRNIYYMEVWIKLERAHPLEKTKQSLQEITHKLKQNSRFRKLRIIFDVDPS
jgi:primosomal protein N' (replication factor Y)